MPASKAQQAATAERRNRMMQLKLAGADWPTISKACGYASSAAACKDFSRALELSQQQVSRNAEVLRHEQLLKLERLQRGVWAAAVAGDPKSAAVALQIVQAQIDLQGLKKLPPPESGERYERQEALRVHGRALAEVTRRLFVKLGLDVTDPRALAALAESVQEVTGLQPATIEGKVITAK